MRRFLVAFLALLALLGAASTAWALLVPTRTVTRSGPITAVGLTHSSVAYSVGRTTLDCDHVELWNVDTRGTWRFGRKRPCGDLPVFSGIGPVAVATSRVVWVSFAGGNLTDWQLWTATPTKKTPRRLAFAERDTTEPPPIVVGPGTPQGVPYAVGAELTWLGENGAPVFHWVAPAEVRSVSSGTGPYGWRVAALLDTGEVTLLDGFGRVAKTYPFPQGDVSWIGVGPSGLVVQRPGAVVEIHRGAAIRTVQLRPSAIALDYADERILYRVGQSFWLRNLTTGADTQLLQGSRKQPTLATLDPHGLVWTESTRVNWVCAACIGG